MSAPEQAASDPPELARCLSEAGYTPPNRALEALLGALVTLPEDEALILERALARAGAPAASAAVKVLARLEPDQRPRLIGLFARLAGEVDPPGVYETLLAALEEPLARSRKLAARGLGKLGDARAEERLLAALEASSGSERKSIVDALGALGSQRSADRLGALVTDDADLARRRERARTQIERRLGRAAGPGELELDARLGARWRVVLSCRRGLDDVLAEEVRALAAGVLAAGRGVSGAPGAPLPLMAAGAALAPGRVDIEHTGTLRQLLEARTALDVALVVPQKRPIGPTEDPAAFIADALAQPVVLDAVTRWTRGVPRFRVSWTSGGHQRGLTWALASALRARTAAFVNDSHDARWVLRAPPDARGELLLVPRVAPDPRFAYRVADVPAASHPTLAAALARIAGVQADDVVWDPFVGSGLELIERARLGPVRELWGSDLDPRALEAAQQNLNAAGIVGARLEKGDALTFAGISPSLIISNPPMGRRVARDGSVGGLLEAFVRRAAEVLRPGGRLVWLSPLARRTERAARDAGLRVERGPEVDLGGFTARVQLFWRSK